MKTRPLRQRVIQRVIEAWKPYIASIEDWEKLVEGTVPKATNCGPVYELPNPLTRPGESFAIADMRDRAFARPHYHTNGEVEIYFVLQGRGHIVVGGNVIEVARGSVVATPPDVAHYAVCSKEQGQGLVMAVLNTPPFNADNVVDLKSSDPEVQYDHRQFVDLTK